MATTATAAAPQPRAHASFNRLRVRVTFSADATGARRESDLTQMLLLGSGSATDLPLVCVSHKIDFARIAQLPSYKEQVRVFFNQQTLNDYVIAAADKKPKGTAALAQYNFYNMMNLFFSTFPIKVVAALRTTDETTKPPKLQLLSSSRPLSSYLYVKAAPAGGGRKRPATHRLIKKPKKKRHRVGGGTTLRRSYRRRSARTMRRIRGGALPAAPAAAVPPAKDTSAFTVFRTTWLNDALNHPVYAIMIESILQYESWYKNVFVGNEQLRSSEKKRFFQRLANDDGGGKKDKFRLSISIALRHIGDTSNNGFKNPKRPSEGSVQNENILFDAIQDMHVNFKALSKLKKIVDKEEAYMKAYIDAFNEVRTHNIRTTGSTIEEQFNAAWTWSYNNEAAQKRIEDPKKELQTKLEDRFENALDVVRDMQNNMNALKSNNNGVVIATDIDKPIARINAAIQAIDSILKAYQPVEQQRAAVVVLDEMDARYASLPNDMGAFIAANYPRFADIIKVLQQFARTYVSSNTEWQNFVTTMTQSGDNVRIPFEKMAQKCMKLRNGISGTSVKEGEADNNTHLLLLPIGLDTVVVTAAGPPPKGGAVGFQKPNDAASSSTAAAAAAVGNPSSSSSSFFSSSSALATTLEAYVQMDVIGYKMGPENNEICGFRDFLTGNHWNNMNKTSLPWKQVEARLFYA